MNPKSRTPGMLAIAAMSAIGGMALAQNADDPLGEQRALDPEAIVHVQPMEDGPFFDRWYAWPLVEFDEPVPGLFNVLRDGKSGELSATLAVDCEARTAKWEGGVLYGSEMVGEDYFATQVSPEVARNIIERHCAGNPAKSDDSPQTNTGLGVKKCREPSCATPKGSQITDQQLTNTLARTAGAASRVKFRAMRPC